MDVRRYQHKDISAIGALHESAMADAGALIPGPWDDDLSSIFSEYLDGTGEFVVGVADGCVVAMGGLRRLDDVSGEIKRMRVRPCDQRKGYGQQVLDFLESAAKDFGYRTLQLDVLSIQATAISFYEKNGYRLYGQQLFQGRDQLLYRKSI